MFDFPTLVVAILALIAGVIGAVAATLVVPEVRRRLGLERQVDADRVIRIEPHYSALDGSGVILNFNPNSPFGYYNSNNLIAYNYPLLFLDITSLAEKEDVIVSPYIEVYLKRAQRLGKPNYYREFPDGIGGGGDPKVFLLLLTPESNSTLYAPLLSSYSFESHTYSFNANNNYTYLKPGEFERFEFVIHMIPGFYYEFSVGVPITYKGKKVIIKLDRIFKCSNPIERVEWKANRTNENSWYPSRDATFVRIDQDTNYDTYIRPLPNDRLREIKKSIDELPAIKLARRN